MHVKIDHVAIKVNHFEENVRFFEQVFGMEVEKSAGEKPMRKVWFRQGIQLNETSEDISEGGILDHIGIYTDSEEMISQKSKEAGCENLPNRNNWFQTPTGLNFELK